MSNEAVIILLAVVITGGCDSLFYFMEDEKEA